MNSGVKVGLLGFISVGIAQYSVTSSLHSDEYYEKVIAADLDEG